MRGATTACRALVRASITEGCCPVPRLSAGCCAVREPSDDGMGVGNAGSARCCPARAPFAAACFAVRGSGAATEATAACFAVRPAAAATCFPVRPMPPAEGACGQLCAYALCAPVAPIPAAAAATPTPAGFGARLRAPEPGFEDEPLAATEARFPLSPETVRTAPVFTPVSVARAARSSVRSERAVCCRCIGESSSDRMMSRSVGSLTRELILRGDCNVAPPPLRVPVCAKRRAGASGGIFAGEAGIERRAQSVDVGALVGLALRHVLLGRGEAGRDALRGGQRRIAHAAAAWRGRSQ